jgi:hypothetical protein
MIGQWEELDRIGRQLAGKVDLDDHEERQISANVGQQTDVACRIMAARAKTPDDIAAKLRFIRKSACTEWTSFGDLFDMILKLDAEHVAASKPSRKNGAAVTEMTTAAD